MYVVHQVVTNASHILFTARPYLAPYAYKNVVAENVIAVSTIRNIVFSSKNKRSKGSSSSKIDSFSIGRETLNRMCEGLIRWHVLHFEDILLLLFFFRG